MKKLLIVVAFISTCTFGQSVTIEPNAVNGNGPLSLKKNGTGIDHRSSNNLVGIGTYVNNTGGFIQTHSNHPLLFATFNGPTKMTLLTNGNVGIGITTPTQKLHVNGNAYFTGDVNSTGLAEVDALHIGGGSPITKFIKKTISVEIPPVVSQSCYSLPQVVVGVRPGDAVTLNLLGTLTTLVVANVQATTDVIEVKYCNLGNFNTFPQTHSAIVGIIR